MPIEVDTSMLSQDESLKQIATGDNHSVFLTTLGKVYTFGLATNGQLGVPLKKGQINYLQLKGGFR